MLTCSTACTELQGMLSTLFNGRTPVNFASWVGFALPTVVANLLLCWAWLQLYYLGPPWRGGRRAGEGRAGEVRELLQRRYSELGRLTFQQAAVLAHFTLLVLLWFWREPRFVPGWGERFLISGPDSCGRHTQAVDDASSSLLIVFLLFIFPAQLSFWPFTRLSDSRPAPALLDWKYVQRRFPWGVAILFGGGFAVAAASKVKTSLCPLLSHPLLAAVRALGLGGLPADRSGRPAGLGHGGCHLHPHRRHHRDHIQRRHGQHPSTRPRNRRLRHTKTIFTICDD